MHDDELDAIRRRADAATPGPWRVCFVDDTYAMNQVAITTAEIHEDWPRDSAKVVAATLVQGPERYASIADGRWDENAEFIAHSRDDIPRLLAEIVRLRAELGRRH
jgi:hypothetical protein